jgi:hypothetical protein
VIVERRTKKDEILEENEIKRGRCEEDDKCTQSEKTM